MLMVVCAVMAQEFKLLNTENLKVEQNGKIIIEGERHGLFPEGGFPGQETRVEENDDAKIYNVFGEKDGFPFRREIAIKKDGSEIEINVQTFCPCYAENVPEAGLFYQIELPYSTFDGNEFTALRGRASKLTQFSGALKPKETNKLFGDKVRCLFISGSYGDLCIDCDPKGINCHGDYGPTAVVGLWEILHEKDKIILRLGYQPKFYGGSIHGKLVLYKGVASDFDKRHSHRTFRYFSVWEAERNYVFGAEKYGSAYTPANVAPFNAEKGFGWRDATGLRVAQYAPSGAFYAAVCGTGNKTFVMSGLRKGLHTITVSSASGEEAIPPYEITCNGVSMAKAPALKPNHVQTVSFCAWIEGGTAEIGIQGDAWRVSAIGDQLLQTSYEDYTFRRGFWASEKGPHPSILLRSENFKPSPKFAVRIESYLRPVPGTEMSAPLKKLEYPQSHAEFDDPEKDWRWGEMVSSLGPGNTGTFYEFRKPEDLARRLQELKDDHNKVIMLNGFLSRHTYPSHRDRVKDTIVNIVGEAHKQGFIVMDHIDYSILWNSEDGFRPLVERLPHLQMSLDEHLPNRGFCIGNSESVEIFLKDLEEIVVASKLDGIMIDEACYHGETFCGCAECRNAFHEDTGWYLPVDETSPELFNSNSALWHVWCAWRQKHIGDFWYRMKERMKAHNKQFVAMGYTTHYGMCSTYASLCHGAALEQSARGWDYIGTEIMSRNGYACYRAMQAYRKAKNHIKNSFGIPTFGLVYSSTRNWDVMYFGWAMNNLNGQSTWGISGIQCPEGKTNYCRFVKETGNMDQRLAKPAGEIAIVFSTISRDWPKLISFTTEILGTSLLMSNRHIEHEFIAEHSLTAEKLAPYKVLMLDCTQNLSDEHVAASLEFAKKGGTLFLTHRVAQGDGTSSPRESWPYASVFGGLTPVMAKSDTAIRVKMDGEEVECEEPIVVVRVRKAPKELKTYGTITLKGGTVTEPAVYEVPYGAGRILYTPLDFGAPNTQREVTPGTVISFERRPNCEKVGNWLIDLARNGLNAWDPGNTPEAVLTSVFDVKGTTVIHFLNCTGSKLKVGDVVPGDPAEPVFPPVPEDIVFRVPRQSVRQVYAVSPDYEGRIPLKYTLDAGMAKVVLPVSALKAYTLVYVE